MVGRPGLAGNARRRVDFGRLGAVFRSVVRRAELGQGSGTKGRRRIAVGALMYEDAAPVAQAARLAPYSPDYRSVVMNKGAMLFHMLRAQMGDLAFKSALHDFYFQFAKKREH